MRWRAGLGWGAHQQCVEAPGSAHGCSTVVLISLSTILLDWTILFLRFVFLAWYWTFESRRF